MLRDYPNSHEVPITVQFSTFFILVTFRPLIVRDDLTADLKKTQTNLRSFSDARGAKCSIQWIRIKVRRRITASIIMRIQTLVNSCLSRILGVWCPETIGNVLLWQRTCQTPVEQNIRQRLWRWTGHTLCKPVDIIVRQILTWKPEEPGEIGRPRSTRRRELDAEVTETGWNKRQSKFARKCHVWQHKAFTATLLRHQSCSLTTA